MSFNSDKDIIDKILKSINTNEPFNALPNIILYLERNHKYLLGKNKKQLTLAVISKILKKTDLDETEKESVMLIAPYMIDSLVFIGNNAGDIFKKIKKRKCFSCYK